MADYSAILDTQIEPDAPLTASLGGQFRDNPIAIAERSTGAPVNPALWHPYDMTLVGTGTGELWSFATDGSATQIDTPELEDGFEYMLVFAGVSSSGTSFNVQMQRASDNGWTTSDDIFDNGGSVITVYRNHDLRAIRPNKRKHRHLH